MTMNSPRITDNAPASAAADAPISSSVPPVRHQPKRRRHRADPPKDSMAAAAPKAHRLSASLPPSSGVIPLPKSHVRRTPSELQLADDMRRAECEDVRMYARLVVGMQLQCLASGYVHPLTRKSLRDLQRTKEAGDNELRDVSDLLRVREDGDTGGWELSHERPLADEDGSGGSVDTPLPCHPMGTSAGGPSAVRTPSLCSLSSAPPPEGGRDDDDDECVFSLEL